MRRRCLRGQALTEWVVVLPLWLLLLWGGEWLYRTADARLQLQKRLHRATWELSGMPLSDFAAGQHAALWDAAVGRAAASVAGESVQLTQVSFDAAEGVRGAPGLGGGGVAVLRARAGAASEQQALEVGDWALPDGSDAVMRDGRAGNRRTGAEPHWIYRQVKRMALGGGSALGSAARLAITGLLGGWGLPVPAWTGTFVVSHNYGPARPGEAACAGIPGYPPEALGGLNRFGPELLDSPVPQCFDTAPSRDTQVYRDSLGLESFLSRGPYFLGARAAQSEAARVRRPTP